MKHFNIYAHNIGASTDINQILPDIKGEIGCDAMIIGDFYTPPTSTHRSFREKINNTTEILNDMIDQLDLLDFSFLLGIKHTHTQTKQSRVHILTECGR